MNTLTKSKHTKYVLAVEPQCVRNSWADVGGAQLWWCFISTLLTAVGSSSSSHPSGGVQSDRQRHIYVENTS